MRTSPRGLPTLTGTLVVALAAFAGLAAPAALRADEPDSSLSGYYGFNPLEIFKLQLRSNNMLAADLNNDGRTDLILIDNSNSRLDLLKQRDKPAPKEGTPIGPGRVNAIESDTRFEHVKIAVDREVGALAVGDFNSDGLKDLAYFSVPDQLNIVYQSKSGEFTDRKRVRLADVQPVRWIMAAGDLNGDKKDDIVVLGTRDTYLLHQQDKGELSAPVRLMNTAEKLGLVQITDVDGDGRNDLCYLTGADQEHPLCIRLQQADGRLGPEIRCDLPRPRGVTFANLDGKPGDEILAIEAQTNRVKVHQLQRPEVKPGELAGQLIQYGFGQQGRRGRDLAIGDLDGDGLKDVVVTDPDSAQMIVFLQQPGAGLDLGNPYPGLMGAEQVRIADLDNDRKAEVVVLSVKEKTIGISNMEEGRLTFPQGVSLASEKETPLEPAALELADLNGDGRPEIVYIGKERTSGSSKYFLKALVRESTGEWRPFKFGDDVTVPLPSLKSTPDRLMTLDANHDGRPDFLIFAGTDRAPLFLAASATGRPTEVPAEGGFGLGNVDSGGLFLGELDKPAILVAQSNFARNVEVGDNNQWRVVDQYNAAETQAKIVGVATIDLDGEPGREIVLVDVGVKRLRALRREGTIYRPWREVDLGSFPYKSTHVADLNGDGRDDLLLFGTGKFGVLYAGQSDPRLKTIADYESKLERTHFTDLVAGDINGDGQMDIAVLDTQSQYVEILNYNAQVGLRHGLYFKIFEAKSISSDERVGADPREAVIADVTGDGRLDLVLLCHDRVLVYPQDDGTKPEPKTAAK
jgi:hypothetical protein